MAYAEHTASQEKHNLTCDHKYVEGQVLVKFKEGLADTQINDILGSYACRKVARNHRLNFFTIRIPAGVGEDTFVQQLRENPNIAACEINRTAQVQGGLTSEPGFAQQWYLSKIKVPEAQAKIVGDYRAQVAVVDAGIQAEHPELIGRVLQGYDFVDGDTDTSDPNGHGTFASGLIAANQTNGVGIAGVCDKAVLLPVRVVNTSGVGTVADLASGITYAVDRGVRLIYVGVGLPFSSFVLEDAVQFALSKNVLIVAPAGNDGANAPIYPAAYEGVLSVTGTDQNNQNTRFNYHSTVDVSAPGVGIYGLDKNGGYATRDGSSASAALATGLAAYLLSIDPNLSAEFVRQKIVSTVDDVPPTGKDDWSGFGRINVLSAVERLRENAVDLAVTKVEALPSMPLPGQAVKIRARIENKGTGQAREVRIAASRDGVEVMGNQMMESLGPGKTVWMEIGFNAPEKVGPSNFDVAARSMEPDATYTDNARSVSLNVTDQAIKDVGFHDIAVTLGAIRGDTDFDVTITFTLANYGNQTVGNVSVLFGLGGEQVKGDVVTLDVGNVVTVQRTMRLTGDWSNKVDWLKGKIAEVGDANPRNDNAKTIIGPLTKDGGVTRIQFNEETHRLMTLAAIDNIVVPNDDPVSPKYKELTDFKMEISQAAFDEDRPLSARRFLNHFMHRDTKEKLDVPSGARSNAYLWALDNDQNSFGGAGGNHSWKQAIEKYDYTSTSKQHAYESLGHTVHLLEDMGQPAHTHLDPHPNGEFEDYVEDPFNWPMFEPTSGTPTTFNTLQLFMDNLSDISYEANYFEGDPTDPTVSGFDLTNEFDVTNEPILDPATGLPIADRFVLRNKTSVDPSNTEIGLWTPNDGLNKGSLSFGAGGEDWWHTEDEAPSGGATGFYYVRDRNSVKARPASGGGVLAQVIADAVVQPTAEYAAGLMQYYHDIVNRVVIREKHTHV